MKQLAGLVVLAVCFLLAGCSKTDKYGRVILQFFDTAAPLNLYYSQTSTTQEDLVERYGQTDWNQAPPWFKGVTYGSAFFPRDTFDDSGTYFSKATFDRENYLDFDAPPLFNTTGYLTEDAFLADFNSEIVPRLAANFGTLYNQPYQYNALYQGDTLNDKLTFAGLETMSIATDTLYPGGVSPRKNVRNWYERFQEVGRPAVLERMYARAACINDGEESVQGPSGGNTICMAVHGKYL